MEKRTESKETERVKERDRFIYHRDEPVAYLQRGSKIQFEIFPTSRGGSRIHLNIYSKKKKKKIQIHDREKPTVMIRGRALP